LGPITPHSSPSATRIDTPQGHYTFNQQKHYGMPDSSNLMSQVTNGKFVPVGITADQLAKAGQ